VTTGRLMKGTHSGRYQDTDGLAASQNALYAITKATITARAEKANQRGNYSTNEHRKNMT